MIISCMFVVLNKTYMIYQPDFYNLLMIPARDVKKGTKEIIYNGLVIATYNFSDTLKTWWCYGKNITDQVTECENEKECELAAKAMFLEWLTGNQ